MKEVPSSLLIGSQKHLAIHVNLLYTGEGGKELLQLWHHKKKITGCFTPVQIFSKHRLHNAKIFLLSAVHQHLPLCIHTATNANILSVSEWFAAWKCNFCSYFEVAIHTKVHSSSVYCMSLPSSLNTMLQWLTNIIIFVSKRAKTITDFLWIRSSYRMKNAISCSSQNLNLFRSELKLCQKHIGHFCS